MRLREVVILWYRSVSFLDFELGSFSVLFGRNNSGKTNVLEALYGVLAPENMNSHQEGGTRPRGLRGGDIAPWGTVHIDLEDGVPFDEDVLEIRRQHEDLAAGAAPLAPNRAALVSTTSGTLTFADVREYFRQLVTATDDSAAADMTQRIEAISVGEGPRPLPMFLDWEIDDLDQRVGQSLMELLSHKKSSDFSTLMSWFAGTPLVGEVLETVDDIEPDAAWRIRKEVLEHLDSFSRMATTLLPDFIDGEIHADLHVPTNWGESIGVHVTYRPAYHDWDAPDGPVHSIADQGRGSSRWIAVAMQIALHILAPGHQDSYLEESGSKPFSGRVLFLDEPEAHLHPFAVASVVRWCHKMVDLGFNIVVATHHEEFLRASGDDVTFVHVTRDNEDSATRVRTLVSSATPLLQELAGEVGMHPATALSLHRAILFVEGPLDEAVLDEYAAPQLDAAGVLIIPIHGTKNLEGLIDGEFTTRLGIKAGVLTDNTVTATMWERSGKKKTGEEKKLVKLIKRFEDQGLPPPDLFGVPEDDLLFALPAQAIREYLKGPFPGWHELREECRAAEGLGPSDSPDWKAYAENRYGLPITTPQGVRAVVHALDLVGVELPSVRAVVDEIVNWARASDDMV